MQKFIKKLIERLEERQNDIAGNLSLNVYYSDGYDKGIEYAIEIVNELAEEYKVSEMPTGWIPCKEEMPSKDGNYLVCDSQGNRYIARYYAGSTTFNRNVGFVAKAWQPLPAPYTEGE